MRPAERTGAPASFTTSKPRPSSWRSRPRTVSVEGIATMPVNLAATSATAEGRRGGRGPRARNGQRERGGAVQDEARVAPRPGRRRRRCGSGSRYARTPCTRGRPWRVCRRSRATRRRRGAWRPLRSRQHSPGSRRVPRLPADSSLATSRRHVGHRHARQERRGRRSRSRSSSPVARRIDGLKRATTSVPARRGRTP